LAQGFGFRSVFVFLLIATVIVSGVALFFLPETQRAIAGNGSLRLHGIYQSLIHRFKKPKYSHEPAAPRFPRKVTSRTVLAPLKLILEKDILMNLLYAGIIFAIGAMVTATTTPMFEATFHLNETLIGLCFIPNGM